MLRSVWDVTICGMKAKGMDKCKCKCKKANR